LVLIAKAAPGRGVKGGEPVFGSLKPDFEVRFCREGRWETEATFTEEQAALACARSLVANRKGEEVTVVKSRGLAGLSLETTIFNQKLPPIKERPLTINGTAEGAPVCGQLDDLYAFPARAVMGRLLLQFLQKYQICTTELLHSWIFARRLDEQGTLLSAAMHAVVRHQAQEQGISAKNQAVILRGLIDQAMDRTRGFAVRAKHMAPFDVHDLAATSARAAQEPEGHDFVFYSLLSLHLQERNHLVAKLDTVAAMVPARPGPRVDGLLDGVMAEMLGMADVLKEVLGPQTSLAEGLCVLADVLLERAPATGDGAATPLLLRIGRLAAEGRAPLCREILVERIRQSLAGDQPLDKRDAKAEAMLVEKVTSRLRDGDGVLLGGAVMEKALARRLLRHRQAVLRSQGMHDIADRLS
jgi:hypothetical protein